MADACEGSAAYSVGEHCYPGRVCLSVNAGAVSCEGRTR